MGAERFGDADRTLDARDVEGEPFGAIMSSLEELSGNESLLLINSFEPEPLYDVLEDRGYEYETANPAAGEWHVEITTA